MEWGMAGGKEPFDLFEDMIGFFLVADSIFTVGKDTKFYKIKLIKL